MCRYSDGFLAGDLHELQFSMTNIALDLDQ